MQNKMNMKSKMHKYVLRNSQINLSAQEFENNLEWSIGFEKLSLLKSAANSVSDSREARKQYMAYANELNQTMKYLDRNDISQSDRERKDTIIAIADELKKKTCGYCRYYVVQINENLSKESKKACCRLDWKN